MNKENYISGVLWGASATMGLLILILSLSNLLEGPKLVLIILSLLLLIFSITRIIITSKSIGANNA